MNASNTKNNHLFSKKKNISDSLISVLQKNNTLVFTGLLSMGQMNPTKMEMALIGQHSEHLSLHAVSFETPHPTEKETSLSEPIKWTWSLNVVSFVKKLLVETGSSTSLNVHLIVHVEERFTPFVFALSFPEEITYKLLKECKVSYGKTVALLSTRPSPEGFVELSTVLLDKQTYATACKKQLPFLSKKEKEETDIWVMGNLPHMPGENSWSLFLTALDHFPGKEIYYILSPTSSAWKMAAKKAGDQLLSYGSEKYFNKLQSATLIVSEKAPYHLFPSASLFWEKRLAAKRVILPAHPLGLTNEPYTFNQHTIPWKIDSLIVSSKTEQRFVKDTLGLDETKTCLADLPNLQMASKIEKQPEKDLVLLAPSTRYPKWHSKEDEVSAPLIELCTDPLFTQWVADNHLQIMVLLTEENQGLKQDFAQLGIKTTTLSLFEDFFLDIKSKSYDYR